MARMVLLLGWLLVWQVPGLAAETLVIPGTGSCEAILQELAGAFNAAHPGLEVSIPPSVGSQGGWRALSSDQCVLARIVVPLDKKNSTRSCNIGALPRTRWFLPWAPTSRVNSLTVSQLVADLFRQDH